MHPGCNPTCCRLDHCARCAGLRAAAGLAPAHAHLRVVLRAAPRAPAWLHAAPGSGDGSASIAHPTCPLLGPRAQGVPTLPGRRPGRTGSLSGCHTAWLRATEQPPHRAPLASGVVVFGRQGMLYFSNPLVELGIWGFRKWRNVRCLTELALKDARTANASYLYSLSKAGSARFDRPSPLLTLPELGPAPPPQGAPGGFGRLDTPRGRGQATGWPDTASIARVSCLLCRRFLFL